MNQRQLADPLYIYANPMKGAAHTPPAAAIIGAAAVSTFALGTTVLGLSTFGSFLFLSAAGLALNALTPKPSIPAAQAPTQRGYAVTQFGPAQDHQVVYGEARVAGVRVFDAVTGTDNKFLHRVIVFTGHEIEEFSEVYLNDYKLSVNLDTGNVTSATSVTDTTSRYNDFVKVYGRLGTNDQTAIPQLVSAVNQWTTDHRLRGCAYLYVRFEFDIDTWPNGIPEITATIKGKKVFDPRSSTTSWSDNPALCIRDYLTNPQYGLGATVNEIDDVLVAQAANVCDENVQGESRYTCNGAFTTEAQPGDTLRNLGTSMGGVIWFAQGRWRMKPAYYTPPVLSLTLDDLRGNLQVQTRASRRDTFNTVRGTFRGEESNWQVTDYVAVSDPSFVAADGGFENSVDLDLPFTSSHLTAQRLARIALFQRREQITVRGRFGMRAFSVQVGDNVELTNERLGWVDKQFEVAEWTFTLNEDMALEVEMVLRETDELVYSDVSGEVFESNNSDLPTAFINVAPQNLQASSSSFVATDGTFVNNIDVEWDAPDDAFVASYEIEWRKTNVTEFSTAVTDGTKYTIPSVEDGTEYVIRVRAVNLLNVRGPFETITFTPGPDVTPPGLPTSFSAEGAFRSIVLSWVNPPDADFDYVEVWESASPNFANASLLVIAYGTSFTRGNLDVGVERYYWIRAIDASGNASDFVGPENATALAIDAGTDIAGDVAQLFQNAGVVGVEILNELPTTGNFVGRTVYLTTQNKLFQWDGSAWQDIDASVSPGSITETEIADDAISTPKLQAEAVTTAKIQANAITAGLIAAGAVTADKISVNQLSAVAAQLGFFQSAATGERVEIEDDRISVFDAANTLRVRIGRL